MTEQSATNLNVHKIQKSGYPLFSDIRIQGPFQRSSYDNHAHSERLHIQYTASLHAVIFTINRIITRTLAE